MQDAFEELWSEWLRIGRAMRGSFSGILRGVSNAREGSKILRFLFRSPLVCSSLLHLRSSGKVKSANYYALCTLSDVLRSLGPMRGFLCGIGAWKLCVLYILCEVSSQLAQMLRITTNMSKKDVQTLKVHSEFIASW
jgi:hypothetical protein